MREESPSSSVIPQGCPEVGEEELVSVPDAKFTKGEFQVGVPPGSLECYADWNLGSCWRFSGGGAGFLLPRWTDSASV